MNARPSRSGGVANRASADRPKRSGALPIAMALVASSIMGIGNQPAQAEELLILVNGAPVKSGDTILARLKLGDRFTVRQSSGQYCLIEVNDGGTRRLGWVHRGTALADPTEERAAKVDRAETLDRDSLTLFQQERFADAQKAAEEALSLKREVFGERHLWTAQTANNLGAMAAEQRDFDTARRHFRAALAVRVEILGELSAAAGETWHNLGTAAHTLGDLAEAHESFTKALAARRKVFGDKHAAVALTLDHLGLVEEARGDHVAARRHHEEALAIYGDKFEADRALTLRNLGNVALAIGDFDEARKRYEASLALFKKALGPERSEAAVVLSNLGIVASERGDLAAARKHLEEALAIHIKVGGERSLAAADALHNLGVVAREQGDLPGARTMFERAVAAYRASLPGEHLRTAISIHELATTTDELGHRSAAEKHYREALKIGGTAAGKLHPTTLQIEGSAARFLALQAGNATGAGGGIEEAVGLFDEQRQGVRRYVLRTLPWLSRNEQLHYLGERYAREFSPALGLPLAYPEHPRLAELSAAWLLNGKSVAHEAMAVQTVSLRPSGNPTAAKLLADLSSVRQQLALLAMRRSSSDESNDQSRARSLEAEESRLEREAAKINLPVHKPSPWLTVEALRRELRPKSLFVDIARLRLLDRARGKYGDDHYVAWVIPPAGAKPVRVVDLGPAAAVDETVTELRKQIAAAADYLKKVGEVEAQRKVAAHLERLAQSVLRPLADDVGGIEDLVVSPDGQLWLVPWAALPLGDQMLIEKCAIRLVVSGRDLLPATAAAKAPSPTSPVIFADPDYDLNPGEVKKATAAVLRGRESSDDTARAVESQRGLPKVPRLPNTAAEALAISAAVERFATKPITYSDRYATEGVFKAIARPRILTLSTHGFFLPSQQVAPSAGKELSGSPLRSASTVEGQPLENPLLRCGLLLAGCNSRTGQQAGDDGILTGLEIVGVDLRGTELVVLSACETGLGDVRNGEGVAGLRQAFQLAGAESVVATLWQIPDRDSALLMSDFFDRIAKGRGRAAALREAQLARIKARRDRNGAAHPFFWAAFTLTGQDTARK